MNTRSRYSLALIAAIFWMVAIVLVYFWIHKPLTPPLAKALGGGLLDFFSVAVMVVISGGTGRMVIIRLLPGWSESLSREERFAAEALLGLGIMSVIIFAVGLIWLNAISMFVVLILLAGFSFSHLPGWLRDVRTWQREFDFDFQWGRGLTWFTGLNLAMALVMALAPPTKFDALTYHLNGAKLWVEAGKFESLPGNHFFGFPQLVNTLYAGHMALLMGRFTGAAALHWMIGVLLLLAVLGYGTRRFNRFVGMLAVGFLLAATS
ncbi:MAG TPA: hypothetical protein VJZ27_01795, partial [Aggregatilineales bacterium]|nr:hypothetical protein [Aggregatilineales bacterium]